MCSYVKLFKKGAQNYEDSSSKKTIAARAGKACIQKILFAAVAAP